MLVGRCRGEDASPHLPKKVSSRLWSLGSIGGLPKWRRLMQFATLSVISRLPSGLSAVLTL
jgi:hypothetical protein